jgi:multisubunit Na+/H+ antiporter MnhC subunit
MRKSVPWLWLLLVAGLLVRLWAMRWPPFPFDMVAWIGWGERVREVGPGNFYAPDVFTDYAPGYIYVMWLTATIKHALFAGADVGIYHFLYRLPPILCDLLTAALIFNVLQREVHRADEGLFIATQAPVARSQKQQQTLHRSSFVVRRFTQWLPVLGAGVHLFNPLVIFNSAVWAQIDSTFTLAMLLALVLALRERPFAAVLSYVVAFLIKPQAIALAPLLALLLIMRYPWRRWLPAGVAGIALGFVLIAPFLGWGSYVSLVALLRKSVEVYPYTSMYSYNLWGVYGFWEDDQVRSIVGLSLRSLGTLLYLVGIGYGVWLVVRALRRGLDVVFTGFAFATYFVFLPVMVLTRMHERYLYPIFPFLLIVALLCLVRPVGEQHWKVLRWSPLALYGVLSVLHTFNLYQVYVYYVNHDQDRVVPLSNWLYYFIKPNGWLWSLLTFAAFVMVAGWLLRWTSTRQNRSIREPRLAKST